MTAIVSKDHAKITWLTGLAGLLLLALSFAMMAVAAPARPGPPATQKIVLDSGSTSGRIAMQNPLFRREMGLDISLEEHDEGELMSVSQDGTPSQESQDPTGRYRVRLTKVSSFVIITQQRHTTYTGTVQQLEASARSVRTHNLILGWWGIPFGLIWTPMALARNAKAMNKLRALASGQPAPVG
jgi:hypothetical protein